MPKRKAKKNSALTEYIRESRRKREMRKNPDRGGTTLNKSPKDFLKELAPVVLPGVVAYSGVAIGSRTLSKKLPFLGRHAVPATNLALGSLLYFLSEKFGELRKYQDSILVGAAVNLTQTLITTYLPALSWLVNTPSNVLSVPLPKMIASQSDSDDFSPTGNSYPEIPGVERDADIALLTQSVDDEEVSEEDDELADLYQGAFKN